MKENYKVSVQIPFSLKGNLVSLYDKSTYKSLSSFICSYLDTFSALSPSAFDRLTFFFSRYSSHPNNDFSLMYPHLQSSFVFCPERMSTITIYLDDLQRQTIDVLCYSKLRSYRDIVSLLVVYVCQFSHTIQPVENPVV